MAVSKTFICNRALSKLGEPRVTDIDNDSSPPAQTLSEMYDNVRDAVLQSYPWGFALMLTHIAKDGTAPDWDYDNRYLLPTDCLALVEIKNNPDYRIRGKYIHTDEGSPLYILYTARITDAAKYPPMFIEALAARLAYESAERITQSNTKKEAAAQDYQFAISAAYASEAIQNPPQPLPEDAWLDARL